jgi:UDP-glucuronate 4-epimerase
LRFFTVYGPYGRPDMALFIFTKAILENRPINIYNFGKMKRDFTYVSDIVEGIVRLIDKPPVPNNNWDAVKADPSSSFAPYRILNIGTKNPVDLLSFIQILENALKKKAIKNFLPMQDGDVEETFADMTDLEALIHFQPATPIETGVGKFVDWYKKYYSNK